MCRIVNQPKVDEATGVLLVSNGEIYNDVEFREQLERRGHGSLLFGDRCASWRHK